MDLTKWLPTIVSVAAMAGGIASAVVAWLTYHRSKMPDVVTYLEMGDSSAVIWFVIKNFGNGVDRVVEVGVST